MIFGLEALVLISGVTEFQSQRHFYKLDQRLRNRQMAAQAEAVMQMGSIEGECREVLDEAVPSQLWNFVGVDPGEGMTVLDGIMVEGACRIRHAVQQVIHRHAVEWEKDKMALRTDFSRRLLFRAEGCFLAFIAHDKAD